MPNDSGAASELDAKRISPSTMFRTIHDDTKPPITNSQPAFFSQSLMPILRSWGTSPRIACRPSPRRPSLSSSTIWSGAGTMEAVRRYSNRPPTCGGCWTGRAWPQGPWRGLKRMLRLDRLCQHQPREFPQGVCPYVACPSQSCSNPRMRPQVILIGITWD